MFQVECKKDRGKYSLSVTHNGFQWSTIRLETISEIQAVIRCLFSKIPTLDIDEHYEERR